MAKPKPIFVAVLTDSGCPVKDLQGYVAGHDRKQCVKRCEDFWGLAYKNAKKHGIFTIHKYEPPK